MLLLGWSFLEGVGAALILPAIVALVASNFAQERRPAAYGMVAAAGAIAVAVGPLIGGFATTYFSWRWVFAGEVVLAAVILVLARQAARRGPGRAPEARRSSAAVLSALGLALIVFGVLKSGVWGWFQPKAGGPSWFGISPVVVARPRRHLRALALHALGGAAAVDRARAAGRARAPPEPPAAERADDVLLPVPRPGRGLLRRPALPLGRAGPERDRDRGADPAALDHAAPLGGRGAARVPARLAAARRPRRAVRAARRARSCCSRGSRRPRARRSSSFRCC